MEYVASEEKIAIEPTRLVRLRLVALQSGSGWTCIRAPASLQCQEPGCEALATHLWVPVQSDLLLRCLSDPPVTKN